MMQKNKMETEFQNPDAEYSMIPFWFLNDRLCHEKLTVQMDDFLAKGINGFVLHPRMGLPDDYEYLGEEYFRDVRFLVEQAEQRKMKVVLYDEGMYPSGSAHGMVVRANPEYAARALRKTVIQANGPVDWQSLLEKGEQVEAAFFYAGPADGTDLTGTVRPLELSSISAVSHKNSGSIILLISTYSHGTIRGIHFGEDDHEPGAPAAADLLNPDSVKKFIELTYDRYAENLERFLGNTVIAMFTDEPSLLGRCVDGNRLKPWTAGFLSYYQSLGGSVEDLLSLWYNIGPDTALKRAKFEEALSQRLEQTYYRQLFEWCEAHHIALTGHPAKSDDFGTERYFQIPGQDIVWRCVEPEGENGVTGPDSTLGKCSSDAARHFGRRRNANECFGCCGPDGRQWEFSAADLKWYMDWLFVRGVNLLYPHAFLYSTAGDARLNERAPDVGPNNLWWDYFAVFSAYAKRMCWLNTDAVNVAKVAVLCGKSSMPWRCAKILQQHQIGFNYLEQELLSEICVLEGGQIRIQNQAYSAAVAENSEILSPQAVSILKRFTENGGLLIACGQKNALLPEKTVWIDQPEQLTEVMSRGIEPDVIALGCPSLRVSHLIKGDRDFFLFVNEGEETIEKNIDIRANGNLETWDAMTGRITPVPVLGRKNGRIFFRLTLPRRESMILRAGEEIKPCPPAVPPTAAGTVSLDSGYTLQFENGSKMPLSKLESWTALPEWEHYSGKGSYEIQCDLTIPEKIRCVQLDCGNVQKLAELWVNGEKVGVRLWSPYRFDITEQAGKQIQNIRLIITNSIANRISGAKLDSGLLGPVTLRFYR